MVQRYLLDRPYAEVAAIVGAARTRPARTWAGLQRLRDELATGGDRMTTIDDIGARLGAVGRRVRRPGRLGGRPRGGRAAQADAEGWSRWRAVEDTPIGPLTVAATEAGVVKISSVTRTAVDEIVATISPRGAPPTSPRRRAP